MQFVTLSELRAHLNVSSNANDAELGEIGAAAEAKVLELTGPVSAAGSVSETAFPVDGMVVLNAAPVTSVTSVVDGGGTPVAFSADLAAGVLRVTAASGYAYFNRPVTVTYVTPGSFDPAQIRWAVKMVAARMWETQRGNTPAVLQGGEESTFTPGLQGILSEVRAWLGLDSSRPSIA